MTFEVRPTLPTLDWGKMNGFVPAIVQHAASGAVLMLGYMNEDALAATHSSGRVTFWSRSKQRLWTKGESSGHYLNVRSITADCDADTLLIQALPEGPVCHLGTASCFADAPPRSPAEHVRVVDTVGRAENSGSIENVSPAENVVFLSQLEQIVAERLSANPDSSYTARLASQGILRIAQKVGEEALELALAAAAQSEQHIVGEAADLVYHLLVLLRFKGLSLSQVNAELASRHAQRAAS